MSNLFQISSLNLHIYFNPQLIFQIYFFYIFFYFSKLMFLSWFHHLALFASLLSVSNAAANVAFGVLTSHRLPLRRTYLRFGILDVPRHEFSIVLFSLVSGNSQLESVALWTGEMTRLTSFLNETLSLPPPLSLFLSLFRDTTSHRYVIHNFARERTDRRRAKKKEKERQKKEEKKGRLDRRTGRVRRWWLKRKRDRTSDRRLCY